MDFSKKKVIAVAMLAYILTTGSTYALLGWHQHSQAASNKTQATDSISNTDELIPTPLPTSATERVWSLLLLGYGGAGHQGGFLTDVMQLLVIKPNTQTVGLIHLPRDILVEYPLKSSTYKKINSLYATKTRPEDYPLTGVSAGEASAGAQLAKAYVGMVTGITPQAYVGIDFNSFVKVIDALGGVSVNVAEGFSDPWYPVRGRELLLCDWTPEQVTAMSATMSGFILEKQFPCRYETLSFAAGEMKMNGELALKYVRSRHSSSDFARGERQAAVLTGISQQLVKTHSSTTWAKVLTTLKQSVVTDLANTFEADLLTQLPQLSTYRFVNIGLSTENMLVSKSYNGAAGLWPKADEVSWLQTHEFIGKQLQ